MSLMPKHTLFALAAASLFLASCLPTANKITDPKTQAGASTSAGSAATGSSLSSTASASSAPTATGAVTEKLIEKGILEIGKQGAPYTLLLFTNESCSFCRDFSETVAPQLKHDYIDTGIVREQVVLLPLKKYPSSALEAAAVLCAAKQGKGMAMHEALFTQQLRDRKNIVLRAKGLQLKEKAFSECLDAPETALSLKEQEALIQSLGVSVIPTVLMNGQELRGLPKYPDIRGWLETQIRQR